MTEAGLNDVNRQLEVISWLGLRWWL